MSGIRPSDIDWTLLLDVRERRKRSALDSMLAERRIADERRAAALHAQTQREQRVDAKRQHWLDMRHSAGSQGCSIAQWRDASAWSGALDAQIARHDDALRVAQAAADESERALDASRRRLHAAAGSVEKATQMQQRADAQKRRHAEMRAEEDAENVAAMAWMARRAR